MKFKQYLKFESVNVMVMGANIKDSLKHLLDLSFVLSDKLGLSHTQLTPDGDDHFKTEGILNLYTKNLSQQQIKKAHEGITLYFLKEYGVQLLKTETNTYQDYTNKTGLKTNDDPNKIRVIRYTVRMNKIQSATEYPELNLSNSNAAYIFKNVLGYDNFTSEGWAVEAADLLIKLQNFNQSQIQGRPSSQDGTILNSGYDVNTIKSRLRTIEKITKWAIENGHQHITVV